MRQRSLIARYLANPRLVILILLLILLVGLNSYFSLPRNLNPQINIPIVLVTTVLPGANPADVESLVTVPLETAIRGLQKIKTVTATAQNSVSIISIQFDSGVDPDKAKSDVRSAVDSVTTLPKDAQSSNVQKLDFEHQPVWTFALVTSQDEGSLLRYAKNLQKKIKDLAEVDSVDVSGVEETEAQIVIKPETFSSYKVNPLQLTQLITPSLKSMPAGDVKTSKNVFPLSIDAQVSEIADLRSLRINLNSTNVALSDIASISEVPKPDQPESFLAFPKQGVRRAVTFSVFRRSSINIDKAVQSVEGLVNQEVKNSDNKFQSLTLINTADDINRQFSDLARDFSITITLVFLVLFIFVGTRQALVSALSAPLSFLIVFSVMRATGITLNFLSLFSLLLSLGLLVDDTVVVISAMSSYYNSGKYTPLETGLAVWRDFLIPIFTTTITTVWAFLPLLLSTGIIGEFIKSIPIVVSTALIASFFVSIFITLPLIIFLFQGNFPTRVKVLLKIVLVGFLVGIFYLALPKNNNLVLLQVLAFLLFLFVFNSIRGALWQRLRNLFFPGKRVPKEKRWTLQETFDQGLIGFRKIDNGYKGVIESILAKESNRRKAIIMVVIFSLTSFLLLPLGLVKNEFFPKSNQDFVYVALSLPSGSDLAVSKQESIVLLDQLKDTPGVKVATADIGRSFKSGNGVGSSGLNDVLFTLILKDKNLRTQTSSDVADLIRKKFSSYTKGTFNVQEVSGGPPAGADIQIKLLGDDLNTLDSYATKVVDYLNKQNGVTNVEKSFKPGTSKLTFVPDKTLLAQNQLTVDQIGGLLRLYSSGLTADKKKFGTDTEDKDITIRFFPTTSESNAIYSLQIPTQTGLIPISSLGRLTLEPNPTLITREDGKRTISVSASVTTGHNPQDINTKLGQFADTSLKLASGYNWKTGGANEENQNSVQSILQAMVLSFILIIITMVVQFSSFRRAIIVMLVIPLSISGVFIIFSLSGTPLSFPALIGILALFGIVVKNSILLVDKIISNEKTMPFIKAIADAGTSRLEPIALTSLCTIIGLVPITLSDPLWRGLGGAIIAGLTFSGTIMLFFIPIVYYYLFRKL